MDLGQTIQIVCVILVLLALVCWFFSAKTWRWHTIAMVVLNFMAAAAFVYLGMRTLKTQREWRNKFRDLQTAIDKEDHITRDLIDGAEDENHVKIAGIHQLKNDIDRVTLGRGRVWRDLDVKSSTASDITLEWKGSEPHGLANKSVVYVFETTSATLDPHFLGEFKVKSATEKQIDLSFAAPSTQKDREKITNTGKSVIAYETMPVDDADAYLDGKAEKVRDGLVAKLPPEVQEELKNKDRQLRDYAYLFDDIRRQMAIAKAESDQSLREIEALKLAKAQADAATATEDAEAKALAVDLARFKQESAAIAAYATQLDLKTQELVGQLNAIFVKNRNMANELVSLNAKALESLNRRSSLSDEPSPSKSNATDNKAAGAFLKAP